MSWSGANSWKTVLIRAHSPKCLQCPLGGTSSCSRTTSPHTCLIHQDGSCLPPALAPPPPLHPHPHHPRAQVHVVRRDGSSQLLATFDDQPSYSELEGALKGWPEAASNKSLMDRLRDEVQFIQDTAQQANKKE